MLNQCNKIETISLDYEYFTQMLKTDDIPKATRDVKVQGHIHIPRYQRIFQFKYITTKIFFLYKICTFNNGNIQICMGCLLHELLKSLYRFAVFPVSMSDNLPQKVYQEKGKQKID